MGMDSAEACTLKASFSVVHLVITSRVPINKSIRPRDEVIMMNDDETYDEIMM